MVERGLMFGLGVTRSGSTWLYDCLSAHPQVHLPRVKEAHWFDSQLDDGVDRQIARLRDRRAHFAGSDKPLRDRILADLDGLISAFGGHRGDADYLDWLNAGAQSDALLVGDITPAYSLLPEDQLARMQALSPKSCFLIVLRDPLARLLSNIRLSAGRAAQQINARTAQAGKMLRDWLGGQHANLEKRSDYKGMFARIDRAIAPDRLLVLFFEQLFLPTTLRKLTDWLGLDPHPGPLPARRHASVQIELDPALVAQAHLRLAPQYDFARTRFGAALPDTWDAPQTRGLK